LAAPEIDAGNLVAITAVALETLRVVQQASLPYVFLRVLPGVIR
jgi:hypothetical protein